MRIYHTIVRTTPRFPTHFSLSTDDKDRPRFKRYQRLFASSLANRTYPEKSRDQPLQPPKSRIVSHRRRGICRSLEKDSIWPVRKRDLAVIRTFGRARRSIRIGSKWRCRQASEISAIQRRPDYSRCRIHVRIARFEKRLGQTRFEKFSRNTTHRYIRIYIDTYRLDAVHER